jgi:hypothetical protein
MQSNSISFYLCE